MKKNHTYNTGQSLKLCGLMIFTQPVVCCMFASGTTEKFLFLLKIEKPKILYIPKHSNSRNINYLFIYDTYLAITKHCWVKCKEKL